MFNAAIHSNSSLSDVQKLTYLKDYLVGEALDTVSGLTLTESNYAVAVELLKERYGSEHAQVNAHYVALMDLPACTNKTASLKKLYDGIEKHLRSLQALGQDVDQLVFVTMITSKIPRDIMCTQELSKSSGTWTVSQLRESFRQIVTARESAERQCNSTTASSSTTSHSHSKAAPKSSSHDLKDTSRSAAEALVLHSARSKCFYCKGEHFPDQCSKFSDLESRKKIALGKCFKCLKPGHVARDCGISKKCYHCGASSHHRSLCPSKFKSTKSSEDRRNPPSQTALNVNAETFIPKEHGSTLVADSQHVVMQTAFTQLVYTDQEGVSREEGVHILFDTGASRFFVAQHVQDKLNLPTVGKEVIALASFGDSKLRDKSFSKIDLSIKLIDGSQQTVTACITPQVTCPIRKHAVDLSKHPSMRKMTLAEPLNTSDHMTVDVLVGLDHYYDFIGTDRVEFSDGLILLDSKLGLICAGKIDDKHTNPEEMSLVASAGEAFTDSSYDLQRFWKLEVGVQVELEREEDVIALEKFNDTIRFESGRYVVRWPWRTSYPDLYEDLQLARGRLKSLLKRLSRDRDVFVKYDQVIKEQLALGVVEEVDEANEDPDTLKHYLPHHCVLKPGKTTTKVRVVYDASAKAKPYAASLNNCLYAGPSLLPDLCGILLRFRAFPIVVCSDIEMAFLQISLDASERDVTRFLWLRDPSKLPTDDNIFTPRFCQVPFGVVSSPFLLAATLRHHLEQKPNGGEILRNMYVDNVIVGKTSVEEAKEYHVVAKSLFASASMNLREWCSNSVDVMDSIPECDCSKQNCQSVLGMLWNVEQDSVLVAKVNAASYATHSKLAILQVISRFFDPLGLWSPITVKAKVLMQDIWRENVAWDDTLSPELLARWEVISSDMDLACNVSIPRYVLSSSTDLRSELHVFCDASATAYAVAVYCRQVQEDCVQSNLIFSKSRVAPLKKLTIPRLELMATLLGSRVLVFLRKEIPYSFATTYLWSDSTTVLHWLKSTNKLPVFVSNRVDSIKQVPSVEHRYVPTEDNPADIPSRGSGTSKLEQNALWWHGPSWLTHPELPPAQDIADAQPDIASVVVGEDSPKRPTDRT